MNVFLEELKVALAFAEGGADLADDGFMEFEVAALDMGRPDVDGAEIAVRFFGFDAKPAACAWRYISSPMVTVERVDSHGERDRYDFTDEIGAAAYIIALARAATVRHARDL